MDHTDSKAMEVVTYVFGCGGCPAACFGGDDGQCDKHEQVHLVKLRFVFLYSQNNEFL